MEDWQLTKRENEVIKLMSQGKTTEEISKIIGVGKAAVRTYKQGIYDKYDVTGEDRALKAVLIFQERLKEFGNE